MIENSILTFKTGFIAWKLKSLKGNNELSF